MGWALLGSAFGQAESPEFQAWGSLSSCEQRLDVQPVVSPALSHPPYVI